MQWIGLHIRSMEVHRLQLKRATRGNRHIVSERTEEGTRRFCIGHTTVAVYRYDIKKLAFDQYCQVFAQSS